MVNKAQHKRGYGFVKRLYLPRLVGYLFSFVAIYSVLIQQNEVANTTWVFVSILCLVWPHLAFRIANSAHHPYYAEFRNLLFDGFWAAFFIPLLQFDFIASLTIFSIFSLNNISAGGYKHYLHSLLYSIGGFMASITIVGIEYQPESSLVSLYACLPIMFLYPLLVGLITYHLSIKLSQQKKHAVLISQQDGLTQVNNRAFWERKLRDNFLRLKMPEQGESSLIIFDLDHFKKINDTYGHIAGDKVIQHFSRLMKEVFTPYSDNIGRYGGEEFGVMINKCCTSTAYKLADNFRARVEKDDIDIGEGNSLKVTVSVGIAGFDSTMLEYWQWIKDADKALYQAKHNGRNNVVVF